VALLCGENEVPYREGDAHRGEGSVSVYTPRGEYQFQTVKIEPYGQGALALAFEQLKEKLKAKGYFDAQYKKPLPRIVRKIALVTAKESAALHDMLKIIEKRWPLLEVLIVDTLVQGEEAAAQIVQSLHFADGLDVDIIVVGRGGGSTEDLWAFNEEAVADAIFGMQIPVVSAVGHEVDVLISDYVADLRAPTPSAAIEMVLPDRNEILYQIGEQMEHLQRIIEQQLSKKVQSLQHMHALLSQKAPYRRLVETEQLFERMREEYKRTILYKFEQFSAVPEQVQHYLGQNIGFVLRNKEQQVVYLFEKMKLSDPKLQCKSGWGQISKEKKSVSLEKIKKGEKFIVEDATVRIEALCLDVMIQGEV
jgi:exodeoxyribonuclease VII large subunit